MSDISIVQGSSLDTGKWYTESRNTCIWEDEQSTKKYPEERGSIPVGYIFDGERRRRLTAKLGPGTGWLEKELRDPNEYVSDAVKRTVARKSREQ